MSSHVWLISLSMMPWKVVHVVTVSDFISSEAESASSFVYATFHVLFHQLMDISLSPLFGYMNNGATYIHVQIFVFRHLFSFFLGLSLGVELVSHLVTYVLLFEQLPNCFSIAAVSFFFPNSNVREFQFLNILTNICCCSFVPQGV